MLRILLSTYQRMLDLVLNVWILSLVNFVELHTQNVSASDHSVP